MSYEAYLTSSASSTRLTESITSDRQKKMTSAAILTYFPCRIEPLSGQVTATVLGGIATAAYTIFFAAGTNVKVGDKLTISNKIYQVVEVNNMFGHHLEILAGEVNE